MAAEVRMVLLGMTGSGKSSSGNTILRQIKFQSGCSSASVTRRCQLESAELTYEDEDETEDSSSQGATMSSVRKVSVLDVPGFGDTTFTENEVRTEIAKSVTLSAPGPHAFVLVVPVGRYTDHQNQAISAMTEIFGEEAVRHHTLVLFTRGDELEDKSIETFLREAPAPLKDLVNRCGGRFHVFNNKDRSSEQVKKLLEKVDRMVDMSPTGFYTNDMFEAAETAIREEEQRMKRLVEEEKDGGATRARKRASAVKRQSSADDSMGGVSQKMKREQLQRGDGGRSNDEEDRVKIFQNYNRVPLQEHTQFRSAAALSPTVLDKIKILVSAVATGLVVGAVLGALTPLAAAGGAYLTGTAAGWAAGASVEAAVGALVAATSGKTAVLLGAAGGALVGGLVGFNAGADTASPIEGAKEAFKQASTIGAAAVVVGAGVGCVMGVGAALGVVGGTVTAVGGTGLGYTASQCSTGTVPTPPPAGPAEAQVLQAAPAKTFLTTVAEVSKSCIKSLPRSVSLKVHVKKEKPTEENSAVNTTYELAWNTNKESA